MPSGPSADSHLRHFAVDFERTFRQLPGLFMLMTPDFVIVAASDVYLDGVGKTRDEAIGRHVFDVFPNEDGSLDRTRESFEHVRDTASPHTLEPFRYDLQLADGGTELRYWRNRNRPIFGPDGEVAYILNEVDDVTDLVRLQHSSERLEQDLDHALEPAVRAAAEYRRALLDYRRLVRHRLANPLTAVTAGVLTLRDLNGELTPERRLEILEAMLETSARLEQAVLDPERVSDVESDLQSVPELTEEMSGLLDAVAVRVRHRARAINARIAAQLQRAGAGAGSAELVCECSDTWCESSVTLPLDRYLRLTRQGGRHVIAPGHELPSVEEVDDENDRYSVVRTIARRRASDATDDVDPSDATT